MALRDGKLPRGFPPIAAAGVLFQGAHATVDTTTVVAAFVHGLTGSPIAVGAVAAISRYGWLFPQIFVAYLAQRRRRRLPYYKFGAFGRAACLAAIGLLLLAGAGLDPAAVAALFFVLWTAYAFVSGVVAVPYNDIVARVIPSSHRSRLLALRFFGGGVLALAVAAAAHELLGALAFHAAFAAIFLLGAALLVASALCFVSAGEPEAPAPEPAAPGFVAFLRGGFVVFAADRRFRLFLAARWCGGAVSMALPFYILQLSGSGGVGVVLAAQTAGALASNPLWGWWGDRRGKLGLLAVVAVCALAPPLLTLGWLVLEGPAGAALAWFVFVFFLLGAVGNGETIAMLGYLMEISPDDRRPAYSGYFNALAAPAALLPLAGAAIASFASYAALFALAAAAALGQVGVVWRLRRVVGEEPR